MCTSGNIGYPISAPISLTSGLYQSVSDTFPIKFKLGSRNTPPIFSTTSTATVDEPTRGSSSTITYNEIVYTLKSAQIVAPVNQSFMLVNSDATVAEFMLTFQTDSQTDQKYIFVVIPLINQDTSTTGESPYFRALAGQSTDGPFSLDQCLPSLSNREFVSYITCLNPNPVKTLVMIFHKGCFLSTLTHTALLSSLNPRTAWPTFLPPTDVILPNYSITSPAPAFTADMFTNTVIVSTLTARESGIVSTRKDNINAYTCVPLDPDLDILGSHITIDTATGKTKPMKALLDERDALREMENSLSPLTPKQIETAVGIFLGALAVLLFFSALGFFMIKKASVEGAVPVVTPNWLFQLPSVMITALLFCLTGFFIGAYMR